MTTPLRFGDLVFCARDGAPARPGLLAELRRSDARVQYLEEGRTLWAPHAALRRAEGADASGSLEALAAEILAILGGLEFEFSRLQGGARCRLIVSHGSFPPEVLDRLRARMGGDLLACLVRPQGMHRIQTIVEFPATAARALAASPLDRPRAAR